MKIITRTEYRNSKPNDPTLAKAFSDPQVKMIRYTEPVGKVEYVDVAVFQNGAWVNKRLYC